VTEHCGNIDPVEVDEYVQNVGSRYEQSSSHGSDLALGRSIEHPLVDRALNIDLLKPSASFPFGLAIVWGDGEKKAKPKNLALTLSLIILGGISLSLSFNLR
jgi:hypothetical protein